MDTINEGESGVAMVAAIIALAHALKLEVVAEGVETNEEMEILKQNVNIYKVTTSVNFICRDIKQKMKTN